MSYSQSVPYTGSKQLYKKLGLPTNGVPSSTPSWEDEVDLFYTATNKVVLIGAMVDGSSYFIFEAALADTPQSTDTMIGTIDPPVATAAEILAAINADATQTAARTAAATAATQTTEAAIKTGVRVGISGRWTNQGTSANRDDIAVTDIP